MFSASTHLLRPLGLAVAVLGALALPSVARAAAPAPSTVVMYSERSHYVGNDKQNTAQAHMWGLRPDDSVTVENDEGFKILVKTNNANGWPWDSKNVDQFSFLFIAPSGEDLTVGRYDDAARSSSDTPRRPGLDIYGNGRGCYEVAGSFEILDIHRRADGAIDRLWLTFEHHCKGETPAAYGEIRIGEPSAIPEADIAPVAIRRPGTELGMSEPLPIWVRATGAGRHLEEPVSDSEDVYVLDEGWNEDWPIRDPDCGTELLPTSRPCVVGVLWEPSVLGPADAVVGLPFAGGGMHETLLTGTAIARTRVLLRNNMGDPIGFGALDLLRPYIWITPSGSPQGVSLAIEHISMGQWTARFLPPPGQTLHVGDYTSTRAPGTGGAAPEMLISRPGVTCATPQGAFFIREVSYGPDGSLQSLSVAFEQHCDGDADGLVGVIDYHASTLPLFLDFDEPDLDAPPSLGGGAQPGVPSPIPSPPGVTLRPPVRVPTVRPRPIARVVTPTIDRSAPTVAVSLALLHSQRIKRVRAKGLAVSLEVSEAGSCRITLRVDARTAKKLGLRSGVLGTATSTVNGTGKRRLTVKLSRKARAAVGKVRSLPVTLEVRATDRAGNVRTTRHRVTLRA